MTGLRTQIRNLLDAGLVQFSYHANQRMAQRRISRVEVLRTLRGGAYIPDGVDKWVAVRGSVKVAFAIINNIVVITVMRD